MNPHYVRPGDVKCARNYKCYHCGMVFKTPQGLNGHLSKTHRVRTENITFGKDWGTTEESVKERR